MFDSIDDPVFPLSPRTITRPYRKGLDDAKQAAVALLQVPLSCAGLQGVPASDDSHGILLIKRSHKLRGHSGQWALPGGQREAGESLWRTAKRELFEETGLAPNRVRWHGDLGAVSTGTGYSARVFVGQLATPAVMVADGHEAVQLSAYPISWLGRSDTHNHAPVDALDGAHFCWTEPGGALPWPTPLWGATAFMLLELRRRLYPHLDEPDCEPKPNSVFRQLNVSK